MGKPVLAAALINIGLARLRRFSFVLCCCFACAVLRLFLLRIKCVLSDDRNEKESWCECARLRSVFLSFF